LIRVLGVNDPQSSPEIVTWEFTPNMTLNATLNPDFSHVEADAAQLDINTQTWDWYAHYRDISPGFRADLGFMPQADYRLGDIGWGHTWERDPGGPWTMLNLGNGVEQGERVRLNPNFELMVGRHLAFGLDYTWEPLIFWPARALAKNL